MKTNPPRRTLMERIGLRVRDLRKKAKLSQAKLGEKCSLTGGYVGFIEQGTRTPTIDTLERICHSLDVSLAEFFRFENPETYPEAVYELLSLLKGRTVEEIVMVRDVAARVLETERSGSAKK